LGLCYLSYLVDQFLSSQGKTPQPHPKQDRAPWINVIINKYIIQYHKIAKRLKPGVFTQLALHVNVLQS
jgi:hypothetical protein